MAKRKQQENNGFMNSEADLADRIREVESYGRRPLEQRVKIANYLSLLATKVQLSDPAYARRVFSGLLHGSMVPDDVFPIVKSSWEQMNAALGLK